MPAEPNPPTSTVGRLVIVFVGLRATQILLRTVGFRRTVRMVRLIGGWRHSRDMKDVERWSQEIDAVTRGPKSPSCLDRSVFLLSLLRLHRIEGDLRIGVSVDTGVIEGHAWVEVDGIVLNDVQDVAERFAVFDGDPVGLAYR